MANLETLDLQDLLVHLDHLVLLVQLANKDRRVPLVFQDHQGQQVLLETLVNQDHLGLLVLQDNKVLLGLWDLPD